MVVFDEKEVKKCLDEVIGEDKEYALFLLEWAIKKRTIDIDAHDKEIYNHALDDIDNIITEQLDKSDNQIECQTLRWVLDVLQDMVK